MDPQVVSVGLLILFPLIGAVTGRYAAMVLPLIGWPLYYVGLHEGFWGYGTGDGGPLFAIVVAVVVTVVSTLFTALAVAARLFFDSSPAGLS